MAALESMQFVHFPPSNPPFHDGNALWPTKTSRSTPLLMSRQEIRRPVVEGRKRVLADNDDESDDDLPSLEKFFQTAPLPTASTEASKIENTLEHLKHPAPDATGILVYQTKSGSGERQGDSPDQPVILDDDELDEADTGDEAEDVASDVETVCVERDTSLYNTFATSVLDSEPHSVLSASGQAQAPTFPQSSWPLQDQTKQQGVDDITRSTPVEFPLHFLPKPSSSGDDGWTDDNMAELEEELGLALEEQQVESLSANTPTRPRSVEAPQDEIQSRERSETTGTRPDELQDTSQCGTAQGLEEWGQKETEVVVEGRVVAMQQQEEFAVQKEELGQPAVGDQQGLVKVTDTDDPEDKETTEALPAAQTKIPEIDKHRFRLRGIRTQPLAGRQITTKEYRIVWGDRLNKSDSWFNEEDIRMSVLQPPCERSSQDMILPVERDITRLHRMRIDKRSKGKKTFEYLVNEPRTWISEDQLTISLSPMLVTGLEVATVNDTGGEDPQSSKRQRLSSPLGATVLNRLANRSRRASSLIPEDKDASSAAVFKSACPAESQLAALMIHNNDNWEVRKIIGKEDIEGVLYYRVVWAETWQPAHSLMHAKELVDEFETRMQKHRGVKRLGLQRGEQPAATVDISSGQQQKRPRGRPRKQT
ncbi:hypothetical protein LSUE1_G002963 [Lachnellula suecica]|uniref:Chromo domain-containing protein n=1 Tax=Lachnellula suecica TaxID=602035 RepID=A0A8T9CDS9_9HELO|nr:hypothetical protein LSUE1_G002963 [Lachnellula suecica]